MSFEPLTSNAELLLQEIIDNRFENGECNDMYWQEKFSNYSNAEDIRIRSLFDELITNDMISVSWADNSIAYLYLLDKGLTYKSQKKQYEKEKKKLSYREWKIAIISGVIGAVIGLIPDIIQLIRG